MSKRSSFKHLSQALLPDSQERPQSHGHSRGHEESSRLGAARETIDFIRLIRSWASLVGDAMAQHTTPMKMQNGQLLILTRHAIYSQQLSYLVGPIKAKLTQHFPQLASQIQGLQFITSERFFSERDRIELARPASAPIAPVNTNKRFNPDYAKARAKAEQEFADVDDPDIRESLISLAIQRDTAKRST